MIRSTITIFAVVIASLMMPACTSEKDADPESQADHLLVMEKGKHRHAVAYLKVKYFEFPLIAEDGDYSPEILKRIARDVSRIYKYFPDYKLYYRENNKYVSGREYVVHGQRIKSSASITFGTTGGRYSPFETECVCEFVEIDNEAYLVLTSKLIENYNKAFELEREFPKELSMLDEFVEQVNKLAAVEPPINRETAIEMVEVFAFETMPKLKERAYKEAEASNINKINKNPLGKQLYSRGSILYCQSKLPDKVKKHKAILACMLLYKKAGMKKLAGEKAVFFMNGRWKLGL